MMNMMPTMDQLQSDSVTLAPASEPAPDDGVTRVLRANHWYQLFADVAACHSDRAAAEVIAIQFATWFPDCTVRIAWGNPDQSNKPDFVVDSKLGALAPNSAIYLRLGEAWTQALQRDQTQRSAAYLEPTGMVIRFVPVQENASTDASASPPPLGMLWITPPVGNSDQIQEHARAFQSVAKQIHESTLGTLASIMTSRPRHPWLTRWAERAAGWWAVRHLFGVGVMLVLVVMLFPTRYRVRASTSVRARDARTVAAPFESTLLSSHVQPGDRVKAGDLLLELDGRPLRIELQAATAELDQAIKDEDIALAAGEIANAQLAALQRENALQRRELLLSRLAQLSLRSPIDGVVIHGDLQRHLGSTLSLGQMLVEIAPIGSLELEIEIPEVEIGYVGTDSDVRVWFPALGGNAFQTDLTSMWPAATVRDEQNVFIARGTMPEDPATADSRLRVGMRGEALLRGPLRPWCWSWVRTPIRRALWVLGW
ncbi:MAG: efflux RND transporter periplasmic adaptor subunit [Planctomycetota bacterium]